MRISAMFLVAASLHVAADDARAATPHADSLRARLTPAALDPGRTAPSHELASASDAGMSSTALIRAENAVFDEMRRGAFPGAAIAIGRYSHVVLEEGIGMAGRGAFDGQAVDPDRTVYDLASLTKVVGTTTAVMLLVEDGKMRLDEPVASYLPEFTGIGKERVTIRHLLTHTSGLPEWAEVSSGLTPEEAIARVARTPLESTPGMRVKYSDVGFVILYAAAERAAGQPLYRLLDERVFGPLGMRSTSYSFGEGCRRCAGTSRAHGDLYRGRVHDPIARRVGGIAGNAGLFSTAHDLARFAAMLANGGTLDGARVLRASTIRQFAQRQPGSGTRALGWDTPGQPGTGAAGSRVSQSSFGHTGFTGTSIWIDPDRGTWVVLLANRTYDTDGNNRMQALRRAVHDHVAESALAAPRGGVGGI
jgi:CubicO group peptidase (beta-lactamase class C family)